MTRNIFVPRWEIVSQRSWSCCCPTSGRAGDNSRAKALSGNLNGLSHCWGRPSWAEEGPGWAQLSPPKISHPAQGEHKGLISTFAPISKSGALPLRPEKPKSLFSSSNLKIPMSHYNKTGLIYFTGIIPKRVLLQKLHINNKKLHINNMY